MVRRECASKTSKQMIRQRKLPAGTNSSVIVERCQVCDSTQLDSILFIGYLPPVNTMPKIGPRPPEHPASPAELLLCNKCQLVQIGLIVDPAILFPPTYPYTSGTTKILRDNFSQLSGEVAKRYPLKPSELIVDIGSNDGTLLSNFTQQAKVFGIEPTNAGKLAIERGIPTLTSFFNRAAVEKTVSEHGKAKVVTATNVFAHIEDIHEIVDCIDQLLAKDGIFISESHYLLSLIETLQYDTIYHEHLRYYSVTALKHLLEMHGFEIIFARRIPTHGGSIRVYAARKGRYPVDASLSQLLDEEKRKISKETLAQFARAVTQSKLDLLGLLKEIKVGGVR